jgi:flagellar P-ring protein FlgI
LQHKEMIMEQKTISKKIMMILIMLFLLPATADAIRLKDIASVKGVRVNQLIGYGLVVGLSGTGDSGQASFTTQGVGNMLENMGVHIEKDKLSVKNVAGVMVTAQLPPFVKVGQTIDVIVSSLGNASSLQGGTLIVTPLKGLDKKVYALGHGPVSIGGFEIAGGANAGVQKNHLTVARIPGGATVEREVPVSFFNKQKITLSLDSPDFTTISRMVKSVDAFLGGSFSIPQDGATIEIDVPEKYRNREVMLLAELESLSITPDAKAKVILDERTGTVVMGANVSISTLALSHGNLSIQVKSEQPAAQAAEGETKNENIKARDQENRLLELKGGASLGNLVKALNSIGVTPRDLIAILQSIKASGALQAELEVI